MGHLSKIKSFNSTFYKSAHSILKAKILLIQISTKITAGAGTEQNVIFPFIFEVWIVMTSPPSHLIRQHGIINRSLKI